MINKVFGIHIGCKYEGGGTLNPLYFKYKDVREKALKEVKKE